MKLTVILWAIPVLLILTLSLQAAPLPALPSGAPSAAQIQRVSAHPHKHRHKAHRATRHRPHRHGPGA
ncbi:MAG: hypothetical protein WB952_18165 [Terriglobales bacterium]